MKRGPGISGGWGHQDGLGLGSGITGEEAQGGQMARPWGGEVCAGVAVPMEKGSPGPGSVPSRPAELQEQELCSAAFWVPVCAGQGDALQASRDFTRESLG